MCYKITDLPFGNTSTVTNQTLYVYADDYPVRDGFRSATVRFSFYKDGGGRISRKSDNHHQPGWVSLSIRMMIAVCRAEYPQSGRNNERRQAAHGTGKVSGIPHDDESGIDPSVQNINSMQWGFAYYKVYVANEHDKFRNGRFVTAESVYQDLKRVDNEPDNFWNLPEFVPEYVQPQRVGRQSGGYIGLYRKDFRRTLLSSRPHCENLSPHKDFRDPLLSRKNRDLNGNGVSRTL